MNVILEYFENRKKVLKAAERMEKLFEHAPALRSMGDCYAAAIASESKMVAVQNSERTVTVPQTLDQFLRQTPSENHTQQVLARACELTRPLCIEHGVAFTNDYPELVRRLFAAHPESLRNVHGAYISDLMAAEYLLYRPLVKTGYRQSGDWLLAAPGFSPGALYLNAMISCGLSLPIFSEHRSAQIRDSVLIDSVKKFPHTAFELCSKPLNRPHLLAKMIADGFYPPVIDDHPDNAVVIRRSMPLQDAMISLLKCERDDVYETAVLTGIIKRHSIGYVVKKADTERLKRVLPILYTAPELLPFVKEDQYIKGLLLEDGLGL